MARLARIVVPGVPHFVAQWGNRSQQVFFTAEDSLYYRTLVAEGCKAAGVECWAYCLLPNYVHFILVPPDEDGLRSALADPHRRYARHVNKREGWTGFLWHGRFASFPMDERRLLDAARYIELGPVRAGLCGRPEHWRWSSARAHLDGTDESLVQVSPLLERCPDWATLLGSNLAEADAKLIERHMRTGRPLGPDTFVTGLEKHVGRRLRPRKRGPKPKRAAVDRSGTSEPQR